MQRRLGLIELRNGMPRETGLQDRLRIGVITQFQLPMGMAAPLADSNDRTATTSLNSQRRDVVFVSIRTRRGMISFGLQ